MLKFIKTSAFLTALLFFYTQAVFASSPTIVVKVDSISCFGASDGKIHVHVTVGIGMYTYKLWKGDPLLGGTQVPGSKVGPTPVDTVLYTGLAKDSAYWVTVSQTGGAALQPCPVYQPAKLLPGVITVVQGLSCSYSSDAKFQANPSGGTPPYTYTWSNGQTTQIGTGFGIGIATVSVKDSKGCGPVTATITFVRALFPASIPTAINVNPNPAAHTDACGALNNGTITIAASGGTGALNYSITAGGGGLYQASGNFTSLFAGTYEIWVKDANGCQKQGTSVTIASLSAPTAYAGGNQSMCSSAANYTIAGATATNYTSLSWSTSGSGTFTGGTTLAPKYTPSAADKLAGSVTLTLTASNATCPNATSTMILTILTAATANAGGNQSMCASSASYNIAGATATNYISLSWGTSGTGTFIGGTTLTPTYTPGAADKLAGNVTLTLTASNALCGNATSTMTLTIVKAATANAGGNQSMCAGAASYTIAGATAANNSSVSWGTSGSGTFTGGTTLTPGYTPSAMDKLVGSVTLTLTAVGNAPCGNATSTMILTIVPAATANAGGNQSMCASAASYTIAGATATNNSSQSWSTSGTGTFTGGTTLSPTYTPSAADKLAGSVTLTLTAVGNVPCGNATSTMILSIIPAATANAGGNQSMCSSSASYTISGATATNNSSVSWGTSGTGTFTGGTTLTPSYTPSVADKLAGSVTLTLTAAGNVPCGNATSTMSLTIIPAATANAGGNQSMCASAINYTIAGATATNNTSVSWGTSGSGTFTGGTTLIPTYTPSALDRAAGSVTLTLTATGNAPCGNTTSIMILAIIPAATANAGGNQSMCSSSVSYTIAGAMATNNSSLSWGTSGSGTFTGGTTLTPSYTPSAADKLAGSVILTLTAVGNAPCGNATSMMTLTIVPAATANAGGNQSMCESAASYTIAGATATNNSSLSWGTSGSGTFTGGTTLTPSYTPSAGDIVAGSVTLTLTAAGNAPCGNATSTMILTIVSTATANAGGNQSMCSGVASYALAGAAATNYSSLSWGTSGTGTFSGGTTLTPTYTPSAADKLAGSVTLSLTAIGNAPCGNAINTMTLTILPGATANAGGNQSMCSSTASFTIAGATATNNSSVSWGTSGSGTFTGGTTLTPTYTPSAADILFGNVTLTLTAFGNAPCGNATSSMTLTIVPAATANAGGNQSMCSSAANYTIAGATATNNTSVNWGTAGTGTFTGGTTLTPTYTPSAADILVGSVTLTLTALGNVPCGNATNTMTLTILPAVTASAGGNQLMCSTGSYAIAGATATNYSSLNWGTSGTGTFTGGTTLTPSYTASAADKLAGNVTLTLTVIGIAPCGNATSTMTLTIVPAATVNAGGNKSMCSSTASFTIAGATATNNSSLSWGTSGTGTFAGGTTLTPTYTPSAADKLAGVVTLTLTATGNVPCGNATSTMTLTIEPAATANAGGNKSMCLSAANYTIAGATATNNSNLSWSTTGSGTLAGGTTLTPSYTPSAADLLAGSVNFTLTAIGNAPCGNATSTMTLTFLPATTANAGGNQTICSSTASYTIAGATATNNSSISWGSSGTGTFTGGTTLTPTYTPSAADKLAGNVTLTITAVGNAPCGNANSTMILTIVPAATANAGGNQSMCSSDSSKILGATATNYSSLSWSTSGSGTFTGGTTLTPTYHTSAADITAGSVTITLTALGNAPCGNATNSIILTIVPATTAFAGGNQSMCSSAASYTVIGATATNNSTANWVTSGSGTFTGGTTLTPTYTPSAADKLAGSVTLTLTTTGNIPCGSAVSTMLLTIVQAATANAGGNKSICSSSATYTIVGATATNASSLNWSTSGTGTFTGGTTLSPTYTPGAADKLAGSVTLTLTAVGNAPCGNAISTMSLNIVPTATASAGGNQSMCLSAPNYTIAGAAATNYSSLNWTTSGSGTFTGGTSLTPTYTPSAADKLALSVTLTLTAIGNAPCGNAISTMILSIVPASTASAGGDQLMCSSDASFTISGAAATNYSSISWGTSGTGSFIGGTTLTPNYIPSAADMAAGSVNLMLTAIGNAPCGNSTSSMILTIEPAPIASAGPDISRCDNNPSGAILMSGASSSGTIASAIWTGGTAFGSWTQNANPALAKFTPSVNGGSFTDTLTVIGAGACSSVVITSSQIVGWAKIPQSHAGNDTNICNGSNLHLLTATARDYISLQWTSSGDGTFDNPFILNAVYTPGTMDLASGKVTLFLEATGNAPCTTVTDSMHITIPSLLQASVGAPAPFFIGPTTIITVCLSTTGHSMVQDMGYYLVAPDGITTVELKKAPMSYDFFGLCNVDPPGDVDHLCFSNQLLPSDSVTICNFPLDIPANPVTGTFGATGSWAVLNGFNPAKGGWAVAVRDYANSMGGVDGAITYATITFTDKNILGDTVTVGFSSGVVSDTIFESLTSAPYQSNQYQVPLALYTSCFNTCDAQALANVVGGTAAYSYKWSDPSVPNQANVTLCPGSYSLVVTDAMGCTAHTTVDVLSPPAIIIDSIVFSPNVKCHGDKTAQIKIGAHGGNGTIRYSSDGGTTFKLNGDFNGLGGGTYNLRIRDGNGCHIDSTIKIIEPVAIIIKDSVIKPMCKGMTNGEIHLKASSGKAPYAYSFDGGTTYTLNADTLGLGPNTYTLFVKDSIGCVQAGDTVTLVDPALLVYDSLHIVKPILCNGDSATVKVYAHGGAGSLFYSSNAGGSWSTDSLFLKLGPGTYHFEIKDQNNCIKTGDSLVFVNPAAIIIAKVDSANISCNGLTDGSIKVTASGGSTGLKYSIDGGITYLANGGIFTNLTKGSYNLIVADSLACQNSFGPVTIIEPAPIVIKDSIINLKCNGIPNGEIHLKTSGGTTPYVYSYNDGINYTLSADTIGLGPNTYTLFLKDVNGCVQAGDTIIMAYPALLVYDSLHIVKPILCSGDSATVKVYAHGGTGNLLYTSNGGGSWSTDSIFLKLGHGTYHFNVKDQNNCIKTGDSLVFVNPAAIIISRVDSSNISCNGLTDGSIRVTAAGGTKGLIYTIDGGITYLANSGIFTNLAKGSYNLIVADSLACHTSFGTVTITEPTPIIIKDSVINTTGNCVYNGEIHLKVTGGIAPYFYSYDNGITYTISADTLGVGPNTYTILVKDLNACTQSGDTIKMVNPAQLVYDSLHFVKQVLCNGDSATVKVCAHGGSGPLLYSSDGGGSWSTDSLYVKLGPGAYHFAVKDQNNCIKTGDSLVFVNPAAIIISRVDSANISCYGLKNGSISITASGGSKGLIYSLDGGITYLANGGLFTNLAKGSYNLIVADSLACQSSFGMVTITEPASILIKDSVINPTCTGVSNGEIHLKASAGKAPYVYSYDGGITYTLSPDTLGLGPNTYTLFAKDSNACVQAGDTIKMVDPAPLVYDSLHIVKPILCNGDSASVKVYAHGGTGSLLYTSNGGGSWTTDSLFLKLGPGTYYFDIKDQNNCTKTGDSLVLTGRPAIIISRVDSANITCNGLTNGSIKITASGGNTGLKYSIDGGITYLANGGVFTNLGSDGYKLIVADSLACQNSFGTVTIIEPALIDFGTISISNISCTGRTDGKILVQPSGGTSPFNYILRRNGIAIDSMRSNTFALFMNLPADTTYNIILNDTSGCGPVSSGLLTVIDPTHLIFDSVSVQKIICAGARNGAINFYGHGGTPFVSGSPYEYTVDGGAKWDTIFNTLDSGIYHTGLRDSRGCFVFGDTVSLKSPVPIIVDSLTVNNITGCFGDTTGKMIIYASGGKGKLQYSVGGNWYNSNVLDSLTGGSYRVSVRDSAGCSISGPDTVIKQPAAMKAVLTKRDPVHVDNGAVFFTNITGGSGVYTFFSASFAGNTITSAVDSISPLGPGFYNTIVKDDHGCSSKDTITLGLVPPLDVSFTIIDVKCFGAKSGVIIFHPGPGATNPVKYSINGGLNYSYNDTFLNLNKKSYTLVAVDTTGKFFIADTAVRSPFQIRVKQVSKTDADCKVLLPGASDFGSISITNISGGVGSYTYSWKDTKGNIVGNTSSVNGLTAGTYSVNISDTNKCSITYTDSISFDPAKVTSLIHQKDTSTCYDSPLILTASTNATNFLWQRLPQLDTLSESNSLPFNTKDTVRVKLLVWNSFNCAAMDTFQINTKPYIGLILRADTVPIMGGQSINIALQLKNPSNAGSFLWTPATELKDASVQNPLFTPVNKSQEYYHFVVNATTTLGCVETDTAHIAVFWDLIVPSGFSPNGDLINDKWIIRAAELAPVAVEVFNRWGEHVFMANPYKNDWDGTYHGKPLPVGTYYYVITINAGDVRKTISGPLTIVR